MSPKNKHEDLKVSIDFIKNHDDHLYRELPNIIHRLSLSIPTVRVEVMYSGSPGLGTSPVVELSLGAWLNGKFDEQAVDNLRLRPAKDKMRRESGGHARRRTHASHTLDGAFPDPACFG